MKPVLTTFEGGATSSSDADCTRYDLVPPIALRRVAQVLAEGAVTHGECNWMKGIPASALINHLIRHIELLRSGDKSEDHAAHASCRLVMLMHFQETRPDLMDLPFATKE